MWSTINLLNRHEEIILKYFPKAKHGIKIARQDSHIAAAALWFNLCFCPLYKSSTAALKWKSGLVLQSAATAQMQHEQPTPNPRPIKKRNKIQSVYKLQTKDSSFPWASLSLKSQNDCFALQSGKINILIKTDRNKPHAFGRICTYFHPFKATVVFQL